MFSIAEVVDGKYQVDGVCSDSGGMGGILYVTKLQEPPTFQLVLKFCRGTDENHVRRFRREVRLLLEFQDNSRVVKIVDHNLDGEIPYFVMRYYSDGDLQTMAPQLRNFEALQESTFLKMIDCVQELHSRNTFHRDIKPANFLRDGEHLVVSDLGLSSEFLSATAFTSSHAVWGTEGYLPPEFWNDGASETQTLRAIYSCSARLSTCCSLVETHST